MPERYQPSPEELGLAQEQLETMSITERETEHGTEQVDAENRVITRTETWGDTQQVTQISQAESGGSVENAKLLTGPETGKELRREHPGSKHELPLSISDPDIGDIELQLEATLVTLGATADTEQPEPWAHFEVTDQAALEPFRKIPPTRRTPNDQGEMYSVLNGTFGGGQELEVNGRSIVIETIGRISIVFSEDGEPMRLTLHKIIWKNS